MLVFNRFLTSCLPVFLALIPLTAFADMALLMKEENSGFVPNYLFRQIVLSDRGNACDMVCELVQRRRSETWWN